MGILSEVLNSAMREWGKKEEEREGKRRKEEERGGGGGRGRC